ncbi:MAG: prepilin-type N-terminal cleavage/methylation domain-containing protein [Candidatus Omnitrophota bacterium]
MKIVRAGKRGFTLAELMVGIVVGLIVILMAAALGSIATGSYRNLRSRADVYNDTQFALQMIRENVRQSSASPTVASNSLTLVTDQCSNVHFYIPSGSSTLVYDSTCGGTTKTAVTLISNVTVFTPDISALPLVRVTLSGSKNGVAFNYLMSASRRRTP